MIDKKHIKALIIIWAISLILSVLTAGLFYGIKLPETTAGPVADQATSTWLIQPATTIADKVRVNAVWTTLIIFPFLFGPLLTLIYCIKQFSKDVNPKPASFHENVPLEVAWTILPACVLVMMAVPAYHVLKYMEDEPQDPDVYVDVTGYQFYWQYNFPKYGVTVTDDGTGSDPLYLPVDQAVLLRGQSTQVNHAWWVPAFGVKFDVIPGRVNSQWFRPTKEGFYKGQCAELCGALHAYMWIHVKVVPEKEFYLWMKEKLDEVDATFPPAEIERISEIIGQDLSLPELEIESAPSEEQSEEAAATETS